MQNIKNNVINIHIELVHTSKAKHKELFNNVLIELISTRKAKHKEQCNNIHIELVHSSKAKHKELFNNVLIELSSAKNAGHKDSSANINKAHANDAKCETDNVKLSEFKKVNDKLNLLLEGICLFMFNKKRKKESIVESVNVLNNITEHTAIIDNKRVCLGDIYEYLDENINDIHDNIKNKEYEKILVDLLLIQKHTFKSINRMRIHNVNKKIINANKVNKANKESNKANKKITSTNSANDKITSANTANNKITNANTANDKITSTNNVNDKITSTNNAYDKISSTNSANEKIVNANNANEKITNGNNTNNNSTCIIRKKSSITITLKRPHVIY